MNILHLKWRPNFYDRFEHIETSTWKNIFSMKLNHFEFDVRIYSLTHLYEEETFFIWTFITKGVVTKGDWDTFMTLQLLSQSRSSIADSLCYKILQRSSNENILNSLRGIFLHPIWQTSPSINAFSSIFIVHHKMNYVFFTKLL